MTDEKEIQMEILGKISGERAKSFASELSKIEHRAPGSREERLAADKIADEMRKLDLKVTIEEFNAISWEHGPAKLTLSNGIEKTFDVEFMPYSPPVEGNGSKGRLAPLRFGFPSEYVSLGTDSLIPIVDFNFDAGAHLVEFAAARSGKKIAALGIISHLENAYRIEGTPLLAKSISFPIFSIKKEDGEEIRKLCANKNLTAILIGKSKFVEDAKSENVIGRRNGNSKSRERLIVSAHHDGWFAGANDNLSSVASIIEAARALSEIEIQRTIDFISFGSEEAGAEGYQYYLWGSKQYVARHTKEMKDIACILNCELAGAANTETLIIDCTPDLVSYYETIIDKFKKLAGTTNKNPDFGIAIPTASQADQINFALAGVPSTLFAWACYDEYHSSLDSANILKADRLALFCKLLVLSTYGFATPDKLPLSLTRYARILRMGHAGLTSHIMGEICKANVPGIDHLKRVSGGLLDFESASSALDSLARSAADLEKKISSSEGAKLSELNSKLLEACGILNKALCRTGGLMGEDPMFPGYLEYIEELRKIKESTDMISGIAGSDIPDNILTEFVPICQPEVSIREFDMHNEISLLSQKRDRLKESLQRELDRVSSAMREADQCIRK